MSLMRWVMVFASLIFNSFLCLDCLSKQTGWSSFLLGSHTSINDDATPQFHASGDVIEFFPKFLVRIPGSLHVFLSNGIANMKRVSSLCHPSLRSMLTLVPRSPRK